MIENPAVFIKVAKKWKKGKWNVWVHYPKRKEAYESLKVLKELTGRNIQKACQKTIIGNQEVKILGYTFT